MRKFVDFDQSVKYLVRSKFDKDVKESFNEEIIRATSFFINHYINGDTIFTCQVKTRNSYGQIITDMVMVNLYKLINK